MGDAVRPKVLFIAGWQRSGTTLIGDLLGSTGGAQHVGELEYLRRPKHKSGLCGCGRPFEECEYWRPVLESDFPFEEWHALRYTTARSKGLPRDYWRFRRQGDVSRYVRLQADLYRRIWSTSPVPIVDSSKRPSAAFAAVVSGEDVRHGKPDPEIYLLAAERLQADPGDCVAIEDTTHGIAAARGAGMRAVAVTHPMNATLDLSAADAVVADLDAVASWILE
jgi:hypothetical protein